MWVYLSIEWACVSCKQLSKCVYSSFREYLGLSSSIRLIKSDFSRQPSQLSSQSLRIFFRSRTFSFLRSTLFKSICFSVQLNEDIEIQQLRHQLRENYIPYRKSQICASFFFSFSQTFSAGIDQLSGLLSSFNIPVADSSRPPKQQHYVVKKIYTCFIDRLVRQPVYRQIGLRLLTNLCSLFFCVLQYFLNAVSISL